jgi:hypothetical protein
MCIAALRRLYGLLPLCGVYMVYGCALFMGFLAAARRLWGL